MKRRKVQTNKRAVNDLLTIYDFVAAASSKRTALRFIDRIEAFCYSLDYASERGTHHPDIRQGLRSVRFERVTILFHVSDDLVTVLRIFYAGRNWRAELDDLKA